MRTSVRLPFICDFPSWAVRGLILVVTFFAYSDSVSAATLRVGDIIASSPSSNSDDPSVILLVDPISGDRTILSGGDVGSVPELIAPWGISLNGTRELFVADAALDAVLRVDLSTGDRSVVTGLGVGTGPVLQLPTAVWQESSTALLVTNDETHSVLRVDISSGDRSIVSSPSRGSGPDMLRPVGLITDLDGSILVTSSGRPDDEQPGFLLRIDPATGDRELVSGGTRGVGTPFITTNGVMRSSDGTLYVTDTVNARLYDIDDATGDRFLITDGFVANYEFLSQFAIAEEASGTLLVSDINWGEILRIDPTTGLVSAVSSNAIGRGTGPWLYGPIGLAVVQVPEPSTVTLAVIGLIAFVARRRRRGKVEVHSKCSSQRRPRWVRHLRWPFVRQCRRTCVFATLAFALAEFISQPAIAVPLAPGDIIIPIHESTDQPPAILRVDPITGDRTVLAGAGIGSGPAFGSPAGIVLVGDSTLFVSDGRLGAILRVDLATGDRSVVSGLGVGVGDPFLRPVGLWLESSSSILVTDDSPALFRVDVATGERTVISSSLHGSGPEFIRPQQLLIEGGQILVANVGRPDDGIYGAVYRVDPATGDRTIVSDATHGTGPAFETANGLIHAGDGTIFVTDNWNASVYRLDPATGNRVLVLDGELSDPEVVSPYAMAVESDGMLVATDLYEPGVFRIDPATGMVTKLSSPATGYGSGPYPHGPLGIAIVQVPEPSLITLAVTGMVAYFARGRWTKCRAASVAPRP